MESTLQQYSIEKIKCIETKCSKQNPSVPDQLPNFQSYYMVLKKKKKK